jgi:hypothetical protein
VIGAIAVTRVIGERDRADLAAQNAIQQQAVAEREKASAEERLEKLTLQQARSKVLSNPTEAVAMLKPLAKKQWRDVRSIAAAARANGIAWSLPAPKGVESVEMSRDGQRVLVAGKDGSVQIYDLAARTWSTHHVEGNESQHAVAPDASDAPTTKDTSGTLTLDQIREGHTRLAAVLAGGPYEPVYPPSGGGRCTLELYVKGAKPFFSIDRADKKIDDEVTRLLSL